MGEPGGDTSGGCVPASGEPADGEAGVWEASEQTARMPGTEVERKRGCSSMVEPQPSKLMTWVRFPSPAPKQGRKQLVISNGSVIFVTYN